MTITSNVRIRVSTETSGIPVDPRLVGIFFEDINFGADGGLSAELVKNGSFEFADPLLGWRKIELAGAVGGIGFPSDDPPFPNNPRYARITVEKPGAGFGIANEGYRGMTFRAGARYRFSAMVRSVAGGPQPLFVELLGEKDRIAGSATVNATGAGWTRVETELVAATTEPQGLLRIMAKGAGIIDLEAVSLMPVDTWKGRANGLRPDLVQLLAELKPAFVRFPGGCIVEGRTLENRYQWKSTVGPVENRRMIYNRWCTHRQHESVDYYQSFRVGFFEYFQLCEDLGAEPLPIINCGMACQFNSGELAPLDQMQPYVQDALDLVEFANGSASSTWGRVRAEMGHPAPFNLKMLGIGNEQWGTQYFERYAIMARALRERHPEIELIYSAGPAPADDRFQAAWAAVAGLPADFVDEHCYAPPEWFLDNADRYDRRDRGGPKVFMGEYAAHAASRKNDWQSALAEAAYLTGLERNADVVAMSAYAPLFAHVDAWQWRPNLIWFDNLRAVATPSYQVQKLFSLHRPGLSLPLVVEGAPLADNGKPRLFASAGRMADGELVLKVVNASTQQVNAVLEVGEAGPFEARLIDLSPDGLADENTLEDPERVKPQATVFNVAGPRMEMIIQPASLHILRLRKTREPA